MFIETRELLLHQNSTCSNLIVSSSGEMVKYHTSKETRRFLGEMTTIPVNETIQEFSLKWALNQPGVASVILDIRDLMHEEPLCPQPPVSAELLSNLLSADV